MDCVKWNYSFVHYGHKSKSGKITQPAAYQSTGDDFSRETVKHATVKVRII